MLRLVAAFAIVVPMLCACPSPVPSPEFDDAGCTAEQLQSDRFNCGTCGRDCGSGLLSECRAGVCSPGIMTNDSNGACAIAANEQGIVFADRIADGYRLAALPDGFGSATPRATGLARVGGLAVAGERMFFTVYAGDAGVFELDRGGTPTLLAGHQDLPRDLVVANETVYWANSYDGHVMRMPMDGGPAELVADEVEAFTVAVDGDDVLWTTGNTLERRLADGGTKVLGFTSCVDGLSCFGEVAASNGNVIWTRTDPDGGGSVWRVPLDGAAPAVIHQTAGIPRSPSADGEHFFWIEELPETQPVKGEVWMSNVDGSNPRVIAPDEPHPCDTAAWNGRVYWTRNGGDYRVMMKDARGER